MITINLLPSAYRKPKANSLQQLPRSPLTLVVVGFLVLTTAGLLVFKGIQHARVVRLKIQIDRLSNAQAEASKLLQTVQHLREQYSMYQRLNRDRSQWAKRLNAVSDVLPDGIWLTDLSYEPSRNSMTVEGSAVGGGGDEMIRIGNFVQALKTHPNFSSIAKDVQIESIKSIPDGEIEVVEFELVCELQLAPGQAALP